MAKKPAKKMPMAMYERSAKDKKRDKGMKEGSKADMREDRMHAFRKGGAVKGKC